MGINGFMIFFLAVFSSTLITFVYIKVALKLKHPIDTPNKHKSHAIHIKPVPTSGGIPIFIVFWSMFFFVRGPGVDSIPFFLLSLLLLLFGILDDVKNLKAGLKLFIQGVFGLLFYILFKPNGFDLGWFTIPLGFPSIILTVFLFMVIVNGLNFMDGIDGLSSTYTLVMVIFLGILYHKLDVTYISLFIGVILGFLFWNTRPHRVFLGDAGIYFFSSILMLILLEPPGTEINLFSFGLLFAIPLMDLGGATVRRIKRRISPLAPDTNHIHHILLKKFKKHLYVVSFYLITGSALGMLAILCELWRIWILPVTGFLFIIWIILLFVFKWL